MTAAYAGRLRFAGIGMVSTPLVALVTGPVAAAALILPILLVQDLVAISMYRRSFSREILACMIPGGMIGILLAFLLASRVPEWGVEIALGAISVVFSLRQLVRLVVGAPVPPAGRRRDHWLGVASGIGSGFTSTIAHAGTPPFQFYVMPKGLDRDVYVGTSVMFFAALNLMKVPAFAALGQVTPDHLKTSLVFLPLAIGASWLGVLLVRRIDVVRFNIVITAILLCVGLLLIYQGIGGLAAR